MKTQQYFQVVWLFRSQGVE